MLKIILISLGFGILSTWISSPRILLYLLKTPCKDITRWYKLNNFSSWEEFLAMQTLSLIFTSVTTFLIFILSSRMSIFNGGTLGGIICIYVGKWILSPSSQIEDALLPPKWTIRIIKICFFIYIALFIQDNYAFKTVTLDEKYEESDISKVFSENEFTISGNDLQELMIADTTSYANTYYINGKFVFLSSLGSYCLIIEENEVTYVEVNPQSIPINLRFKNAVEIGVTSDNNNPYFVYALLKKENILGKYTVNQYALYNPTSDTEKITYYDKLPKFAIQ